MKKIKFTRNPRISNRKCDEIDIDLISFSDSDMERFCAIQQ